MKSKTYRRKKRKRLSDRQIRRLASSRHDDGRKKSDWLLREHDLKLRAADSTMLFPDHGEPARVNPYHVPGHEKDTGPYYVTDAQLKEMSKRVSEGKNPTNVTKATGRKLRVW